MDQELRANILLVDDREDKRLALETIMADLGQNIVQATSGRDALRHLLKQEFAVILLDVNMPQMDGFETALLIRQKKSLENVPIIFVSAVSDTETHVSRGYSLGAVDYILAPVIPEILRAKVAVFVELFKVTEKVRRQAEDLKKAHDDLELRVSQRTQELAETNKALQVEIAERKRAEESLRQWNSDLEQRVADRTAELRAANKEMEDFTYSIAHDLRAPFRQIHGFTEILKEDFSGEMTPQARSYLDRIGNKSRDMGKMVEELLNLFGLAKQTVEFQNVDLNQVVEEVVAGMTAETANRVIDWRIGKLPTARCNRGLIKQVFQNLLSNAVKYTRPKNPTIIEVGMERHKGEQIIYVRDNGVGFDMTYVDRLFGVFQRLHRMEEFEGTGIGLALVSRIIRKHGGRVWAESELGQGATFRLTLGET